MKLSQEHRRCKELCNHILRHDDDNANDVRFMPADESVQVPTTVHLIVHCIEQVHLQLRSDECRCNAVRPRHHQDVYRGTFQGTSSCMVTICYILRDIVTFPGCLFLFMVKICYIVKSVP